MNKVITIYYSYTGNTKQIAEHIQKCIGGDLLQLEPENPYSGGYNDVVEQGRLEEQRDFRPKLMPFSKNPSEYETVLICTPIWWYTMAPVMKSFLGCNELSGKKIVPIITNGGYGLGHSIADLKKLCPKADIERCLELPFDESKMRLPIHTVDQHLKSLGLM